MDGGDLSILVDRLCGLTRSMIHIVVNEVDDAAAILGSPLPPDNMTMGDYPGLRQANQDISPTIEERGT